MAAAGIPFLPDHWYYNTESGELTNGNNLENLGNNLLGGLGWHELNIPGSDTEAQAAAAAKAEFPAGKTPTTSLATGAANTAQNEIGSVLGGGFKLVFGNTTGLLTRILKVVFGGILLIAGILKLSGTDKKLEQVLPVVGGPAGKVLAA